MLQEWKTDNKIDEFRRKWHDVKHHAKWICGVCETLQETTAGALSLSLSLSLSLENYKYHHMKDIDHIKAWKDNITSATEALRAHTCKKDYYA
jgi:hypothetical protein